jgi:hypothetical protein
MSEDLLGRLRANGLDECDEAIDRIEALEAAILEALRAPDEASTREILRKARDGE